MVKKNMKIMTMRNITLILCSLLVLTCASSLKEKCTGTECKLQNTVHTVTYTHKGSRSEAEHGHLFINDVEIPDVFTRVISNDIEYRFYQRKYLWGKDGYFPVSETERKQIKTSSKQITIQDLNQGWYTGKERLEGTPETWFYAEWYNGSAFTDPEEAVKMIKALDLQIIPRWKGPEAFPGRK